MTTNRSLWLQRLVGALREGLRTVLLGALSAGMLCYGVIQTLVGIWRLRPPAPPSGAGVVSPLDSPAVVVFPDSGTLVMLLFALVCIAGGAKGVLYAVQRIETIGNDTTPIRGSENA